MIELFMDDELSSCNSLSNKDKASTKNAWLIKYIQPLQLRALADDDQSLAYILFRVCIWTGSAQTAQEWLATAISAVIEMPVKDYQTALRIVPRLPCCELVFDLVHAQLGAYAASHGFSLDKINDWRDLR